MSFKFKFILFPHLLFPELESTSLRLGLHHLAHGMRADGAVETVFLANGKMGQWLGGLWIEYCGRLCRGSFFRRVL